MSEQPESSELKLPTVREGEITVCDAVDGLHAIPTATVDAIVTDPPYGWAYMEHHWDTFSTGSAYTEFTKRWAVEAVRVLRPAGHILVFAAPRMYHFMAIGLDLAGFDVVEQLQWLHGQGMPKGKQLLKPAHEPIALATRRGHRPHLRIEHRMLPAEGREARFPANVLLDNEAAAMLDQQSGVRASGTRRAGVRKNMGYHGAGGDGGPAIAGTRGGASRFFFVSKVRRKADQLHETQKPLELMEWLVGLVAAPGELVVDPFIGAGTTAVAAMNIRCRWLGFDMDRATAEKARQRISEQSG